MVRDFVKWDDNPASLSHFAESAVRAYKIAMTPPYEPVLIVADGELQEEPIEEKNLRIPKLVMAAPPQGDAGAVKEAARLLVAAENPVIVAGRMARSQHGMDFLAQRRGKNSYQIGQRYACVRWRRRSRTVRFRPAKKCAGKKRQRSGRRRRVDAIR